MKTLVETGLSEEDLGTIRNEINKITTIETVTLFGSRAKGSFKKGSDVDLALDDSFFSRKDVLNLSYRLNQETVLPYQFDIISISDADNAVRDHITRVGIPVYP